MKYQLVFKGETSDEVSTEQAHSVAAKLFKLDTSRQAHQDKIHRLFSGKPVILKKGLSNDNANTLKDKLQKAGLVCYLRQQVDAPSEQPLQVVKSDQAIEPARADTDEGGLSLVPMESRKETTDVDTTSENNESGELSLVAMEKKPDAEEENTDSDQSVAAASNDTTAAASEPQGLYSQYNTRFTDDTSGGGPGSYVPDDVSGWCWGGFFWGWIWSIFNRTWIGLLGLIPVVNIGVAILLGLKGREWAWQNCNWDDIEHFNRVQRYWSLTGLVFALIGIWFYWSAVSSMPDMAEMETMVDEQGMLKDDYIDSIQDERQREAMKMFQQALREELERQQAQQR